MPDNKFWLDWLKEENKDEREKKIRSLWVFQRGSQPHGIVTAQQLNGWLEELVKAICQKLAINKP